MEVVVMLLKAIILSVIFGPILFFTVAFLIGGYYSDRTLKIPYGRVHIDDALEVVSKRTFQEKLVQTIKGKVENLPEKSDYIRVVIHTNNHGRIVFLGKDVRYLAAYKGLTSTDDLQDLIDQLKDTILEEESARCLATE